MEEGFIRQFFRKYYGFSIFLMLFGFTCLVFYVRGCIYTATADSIEWNNDSIIAVYTYRYNHDPEKFDCVVKTVGLTKNNEAMWITYNDGYHIHSRNGNLDTVYPYLIRTFSHYFDYDRKWGQSPELLSKDGFVIIATPYCFNAYKHKVAFVYCPKTEMELFEFFKDYKYYENTSRKMGRCRWLHRLDEHWYVCSPAKVGFSMVTGRQ